MFVLSSTHEALKARYQALVRSYESVLDDILAAGAKASDLANTLRNTQQDLRLANARIRVLEDEAKKAAVAPVADPVPPAPVADPVLSAPVEIAPKVAKIAKKKTVKKAL